MKKGALFLGFILFAVGFLLTAQNPPSGFSKMECYLPNSSVALRYATTDNFMGRVVPGYENPTVVLSTPALVALQKVQKEVEKLGFQIKVYDGYRPQKAVTAFVHWAAAAKDTIRKSSYYPNILKNELFDRGYIARKSGHSRGSTVDITLVHISGPRKGEEIDMGSPWDFFGPISWVDSPLITETQQENRQLLQRVMIANGFRPYSKEWWHFTLEKEPFPTTYFDF